MAIESDGFHRAVGEVDGDLGGVGDAHVLQRILEAHDAEAHRAVAQVGAAGLGDGVEIDVDDVVEHAHGDVDGALEPVHDRGRAP